MPQLDFINVFWLFQTIFVILFLFYNFILFYSIQPFFFIKKFYIKIIKMQKNQILKNNIITK